MPADSAASGCEHPASEFDTEGKLRCAVCGVRYIDEARAKHHALMSNLYRIEDDDEQPR